jgi:hypothetical protein
MVRDRVVTRRPPSAGVSSCGRDEAVKIERWSGETVVEATVEMLRRQWIDIRPKVEVIRHNLRPDHRARLQANEPPSFIHPNASSDMTLDDFEYAARATQAAHSAGKPP